MKDIFIKLITRLMIICNLIAIRVNMNHFNNFNNFHFFYCIIILMMSFLLIKLNNIENKHLFY